MQTLNQGNNEQLCRGLSAVEGGFLAMTFTQSKAFKSRAAAVRWLSKRGVIVE